MAKRLNNSFGAKWDISTFLWVFQALNIVNVSWDILKDFSGENLTIILSLVELNERAEIKTFKKTEAISKMIWLP